MRYFYLFRVVIPVDGHYLDFFFLHNSPKRPIFFAFYRLTDSREFLFPDDIIMSFYHGVNLHVLNIYLSILVSSQFSCKNQTLLQQANSSKAGARHYRLIAGSRLVIGLRPWRPDPLSLSQRRRRDEEIRFLTYYAHSKTMFLSSDSAKDVPS